MKTWHYRMSGLVDKRPVILYDYITGEEFGRYKSISQAAAFLGRAVGSICNSIGTRTISGKYRLVTRRSDGRKFYALDQSITKS